MPGGIWKGSIEMSETGWDDIYKKCGLEGIPWHSGQPDRFLVKLVNEKKIKKGLVLDLCSGDGTNSIYLASKGFEVKGVDISPTAVEIARERCSQRKLHCDYHVGNVLEVKFDEKFDFIFDRGCFHHISKKDKRDYVRLVNDLLAQKGKFYLLCFSDRNPPHKKNLSKEDIKSYFSPYFRIFFIRDSIHKEPPKGNKRYLYATFMEKRTEGVTQR